MHIVMYLFVVKKNHEEQFIDAWKGLTSLIYKNHGSLGSRLHKKSSFEYIAYAQWPNKAKFEAASGVDLPQEANKHRDLMRMACDNIEVINKFDVVEDLLVNKLHD